jgi:hypothetical protein
LQAAGGEGAGGLLALVELYAGGAAHGAGKTATKRRVSKTIAVCA